MKYKLNSEQTEKGKQAKAKTEKYNGQELNSRMFLASSQCRGSKSNYLFAFGAESLN